MPRHFIALLVPAMLFLGMAGADAHAFLDHAIPAVGSTVPTAPKRVTLWFTEAIEPVFSSVRVLDRRGQDVDASRSAAGKDGRSMTVSLRPLPPGVYKVLWRAVSVDTHVTKGDFTFTVAP